MLLGEGGIKGIGERGETHVRHARKRQVFIAVYAVGAPYRNNNVAYCVTGGEDGLHGPHSSAGDLAQT